MQLSFIIPVFNVELYIERCLRSLLDQDIPPDQYEIICINDGSTDKSKDVIDTIKAEYKNIILIEQSNQGVSTARNKGIAIARGEYLMMVDSDDFILPNILKERLRILDKYKPDVAYAGYVALDENLKEEFRFDPDYDIRKVLSGIDFINSYMKGKDEILIPHSSVGIFFRTDFLRVNGLVYLEGVPYLEDGELMARITCLANRVIFINGAVYRVVKRIGSASHSKLYFSDKARQGFLNAANDLLHFKMNACRNDRERNFMNQSIVQFVIVYLIAHEGSNLSNDYKKLKNNLKNGPLKVLTLDGCSKFYYRMGKSYNRSILCFYLNWKLYKIKKSISLRFRRIIKVD
jgi:glycosyltransferase involved in cell wall biosynthesis